MTHQVVLLKIVISGYCKFASKEACEFGEVVNFLLGVGDDMHTSDDLLNATIEIGDNEWFGLILNLAEIYSIKKFLY